MGRFATLYFFICVVLVIGVNKCIALKEVHVSFPGRVEKGDNVVLNCEFNLEGNKLYNVKWYKDQSEFFRFVPEERPEKKIFPLRAIEVDVNQSSLHQIKLKNVSKKAEGKYTCEVISDAPSFLTLSDSKSLFVELERDSHSEDHVYVVNSKPNEAAKIFCTFNSSSLKYIRWFKDGREFYKYTPGDELTVDIENLPGIYLSTRETNISTEITLHKVTSDTEGLYKCDIRSNNIKESYEKAIFVLVSESFREHSTVNVKIPKLVRKGENATLICLYEIEYQLVTKVSWFKGNREIFWYRPGSNYVKTSFPGVNVKNLARSEGLQNGNRGYSVISLTNVSLETGGEYKCQIQAGEKGAFSTSRTLIISHIPTGEPTLFVANDYLKYGDILHADCASPPSYPAANITWYWDEEDVTYLSHASKNKHTVDGFPVPVTSSLIVTITGNHYFSKFENGKSKLSCVVSINTDYRKEKSAILEKNPDRSMETDFSLYPAMSGAQIENVPTAILVMVSALFLPRW